MRSRAGTPLTLAWHSLARHRSRLFVTVLGIATATVLIVFQGSLLHGFVAAAGKMISSTDGDLWVLPRGVQCFEFSGRLPERFGAMARSVPGVERVAYVAAGFATLRRPDGGSLAVVVVGKGEDAAPAYPFAAVDPGGRKALPGHFSVERSAAPLMGIDSIPASVEIADRRARVTRLVDAFGTFMGSPFMFGRYEDVREMLGLARGDASYVVLKTDPGVDLGMTKAAVQSILTETDVKTSAEFRADAGRFWLLQTGAGGGFVVAAVLGFFVGLVIVSQTVHTTALENRREFAVLRAMGAPVRVLRAVVLIQALAAGIVGTAVGLLLTWPVVWAASVSMVSWIQTPWWLRIAAVFSSLLMCALSSLAAIRLVERIDPEEVLRQ